MQELRPKQLSGQVAKHFNRKEKVYGQFWTPQVVADFYSRFFGQTSGTKQGIGL